MNKEEYTDYRGWINETLNQLSSEEREIFNKIINKISDVSLSAEDCKTLENSVPDDLDDSSIFSYIDDIYVYSYDNTLCTVINGIKDLDIYHLPLEFFKELIKILNRMIDNGET